MLNMRFVLPDHLIDLNTVAGLAFIREETGVLAIGAMTRQRALERSALVRELCPLMHAAIGHVGHVQTRNRGTLGGSLAHLDPAAELVAVAVALDATLAVEGASGRRELPAAQWSLGYMTPAIGPDELLVAARFPIWPPGHGYAFVEFVRRHGDFAIVSAAALIHCNAAGRIARAALAIGGVGAAPVRLAALEAELVGATGSPQLFAQAAEACRAVEAMDDIHASAGYRRHLAAVLGRRALVEAHARAVAGVAG
jgi:carbon-monoxide dehydrogenase medium subunit